MHQPNSVIFMKNTKVAEVAMVIHNDNQYIDPNSLKTRAGNQKSQTAKIIVISRQSINLVKPRESLQP